MAVVDTVEILKGRSLADDEYFKAAVLGWCVELVRFPLFALRELSVDVGVNVSFKPSSSSRMISWMLPSRADLSRVGTASRKWG